MSWYDGCLLDSETRAVSLVSRACCCGLLASGRRFSEFVSGRTIGQLTVPMEAVEMEQAIQSARSHVEHGDVGVPDPDT